MRFRYASVKSPIVPVERRSLLKMRNIAYGATILFTAAVAVMELFLEAPVLLLFVVASLALVGLAWVLGQATESVGHYAGPRIGGIMNATFGNAAELIITIFALSAASRTAPRASLPPSLGRTRRCSLASPLDWRSRPSSASWTRPKGSRP